MNATSADTPATPGVKAGWATGSSTSLGHATAPIGSEEREESGQRDKGGMRNNTHPWCVARRESRGEGTEWTPEKSVSSYQASVTKKIADELTHAQHFQGHTDRSGTTPPQPGDAKPICPCLFIPLPLAGRQVVSEWYVVSRDT